MVGPLGELTMEAPGVYYDHLVPFARSVDIWETEYFRVMESSAAIVDWIASTGLRPFLAALETEDETQGFLARVERARRASVPAAVRRCPSPSGARSSWPTTSYVAPAAGVAHAAPDRLRLRGAWPEG